MRKSLVVAALAATALAVPIGTAWANSGSGSNSSTATASNSVTANGVTVSTTQTVTKHDGSAAVAQVDTSACPAATPNPCPPLPPITLPPISIPTPLPITVPPTLPRPVPPPPVRAKTVHAIFFTSADAGMGPGPLFLHGAINAACTDNQGQSIDQVTCPTGTFAVDHTSTGNDGTFTFNQLICVGVFQFRNGPFTVGDGTGAYAGIHGSGLATGSTLQVAPRLPSGACNTDPNATPVAGFTQITATFTFTI